MSGPGNHWDLIDLRGSHMPARTSEARWEGNLKEGKGTMKLGSGAYEGAYSFPSRFEEGNNHCQLSSFEALGYFLSKPSGILTLPNLLIILKTCVEKTCYSSLSCADYRKYCK